MKKVDLCTFPQDQKKKKCYFRDTIIQSNEVWKVSAKLESYFDLGDYSHKALFRREEPVWFALEHLAQYLKSLPLGKIEVEIPAGVHLVNPEWISIGKGTVVEAGAYIQGPCWIGQNCTIRHAAYIRGGVLAGDRCVIGHCTEIKNSILLDGAHAAHFAYIGDSILGKDCNLGAGTRLANLRLKGDEVVITIDGKRVHTGRRKLGASVGDGVQLGCNCVANPGTLIGRDAFVYPCVNFGGVIDARARIKGEMRHV